MNKSETIVKLAEALSKAQAEMPAVKFNSTNPFLKNKYADLGAIIETAQPIITKHGLSVSQLVYSDVDKLGVETVLFHASGEFISSSMSMAVEDQKGLSHAQVAGSIITYLRRYSLAAILGMYADQDGDGNAAKAVDKQSAPQAIKLEGKPLTMAEGNKILGFGDDEDAEGKVIKALSFPEPHGEAAQDDLDAQIEHSLRTGLVEPEVITVEWASKIHSNSAHNSYGNLSLADLTVRFNGLSKSLKDNNLSPAERADKELKQKAIKVLINAKKDGSIK